MNLKMTHAPPGQWRRRLLTALGLVVLALILMPAPGPESAPVWKVYHNRRYGFSFEYPAAWDRNAYKAFCGLRARRREIRLGARTFLFIKDSQGTNLTVQTERFIRQKAEYGFKLESRKETLVAGIKAVSLEFSVEDVPRFGAATLFEQDQLIFILDWSGGSASCDLEDQGVQEFCGDDSVYEHILKTFKFEKTILPPLFDMLLEGYKNWLP
jgi:hypothetical protein